MMKNDKVFFVAVLLLLTIILFEYSHVDIWLQDYLYDFESSRWLLDRDEKVLKALLYDGIKAAIIVCVLIVLASAIYYRKSPFVQNNKEGISIFLLSAILVPLVVGAIKATTNVPCPRDLEHYGGTYPLVSLLSSYPESFQQSDNIRCYPAGHASGGFALLSLVFFFKREKQKVMVASVVLSIGWAMGAYKMLIGDHFLSHTVVTMLLAWLIILLVAKAVYSFFGRAQEISSASGDE